MAVNDNQQNHSISHTFKRALGRAFFHHVIEPALEKGNFIGSLTITMPGRQPVTYKSGHPDSAGHINAEMRVFDEICFYKMARRGLIAVGESYVDKDWTPGHDPLKLQDLLLFGDINRASLSGVFGGINKTVKDIAKAVDRQWHAARANTEEQVSENVAYHYDHGVDFYRPMLGSTMVYTSAYFKNGNETLDEAQTAKIDEAIAKLDLAPGKRLLDIGCGFGELLIHAAQETGCKGVGVTLSRSQFEEAVQRVKNSGVDHLVEIRLMDYRDLSKDEKFDAITSIEMIEQVGANHLPEYFSKVNTLLKDGGKFLLQAITISDALYDGYNRGVDFIQRYIFPGGHLPSDRVLRHEFHHAGLNVKQDLGIGPHYARTLMEWMKNFEENWPKIRKSDPQKFDGRFKRTWEFYLGYCAAGFNSGSTNVRQYLIEKEPPKTSVPYAAPAL